MAAPERQDEVAGKAFDRVLLARLLGFVRPHRALFAATVLTVLAASGIGLIGPFLVRLAIDGPLTRGAAGEIEVGAAMTALAGIAALYLLVILFDFAGDLLGTVLTNLVGQRIIRDLRRRVFDHLQEMGLRFYDRNPVGRLVTRVTSDVEALSELFSSGLAMVFQDLFVIAIITVVLFLLDVRLAAASLVVVPLLLVVSEIFKRRSRAAYRNVREKLARMNARFQETLSGIRVVQLFVQERANSRKFRRINHEFQRANLDTVLNYSFFFPAVELLMAAGLAGIVWFGGTTILADTQAGRASLTFGILVQFILYLRRLFEPIRQLSEKYNILQSAMAAAERIFKVLDTDVEVAEPERPVALPGRIRGAIEFRDVHFAYREGEPVLRGVSFRVDPGESVAVVGATGAGKSTVLNLLLRFYDVTEGSVHVDGHDVRDLAIRDLRRRVGIVLQDVFLFSRSILENIRLGDPSVSRERVEAAVRTVHADRFIRRLPHGLDTELRERGANLSVGQRQLLSFARALVFDPEILVLDEATSSVDTETEVLIQDALARLLEGRTSVVVAHRLSTIRRVDRIVVFHHGEIREAGSHDELIRRGGIYERLYQLQYRGAS